MNLLSVLKVSSFVFHRVTRKSMCSHICVDRRRREVLTTTWKKNLHTLAVSTNGFLPQLKSLTCDPEQIVHDNFFFSCTRIKVNYIPVMTGVALWKEVKCSGCWSILSFYWEKVPFEKTELQTLLLMQFLFMGQFKFLVVHFNRYMWTNVQKTPYGNIMWSLKQSVTQTSCLTHN